MPRRLYGVLLAVLVALIRGVAPAQEVTLTLATLDPPPTPLNTQELHPWADRVNAQGKGVVQIVVRDGSEIANQQNIYESGDERCRPDRPRHQSFIGGKFPLTEVVALPFVVENGESASVAFWRLYKSGALDSEI